MFFYVVFALCIPPPRRLALAVSGAALCAVVVLGPWLPKPFDFWSNQIVLNFVFGLVIGSAYSEGARISRATGAFLCALGLAGIAASSWLGDLGSIRILHWSIPAALIVTGCALSPLGSGRHWATLKLAAIGDASYALYLIHPFMSVPRLIVQKLADPSFAPWLWWPTAYAAVLIAGCVVAALIVHRLFEAPVTRYLKRWLATRTAKLPVAAV
jgi:peptidoglycan/LPS O-acetylase OafA/YrhL